MALTVRLPAMLREHAGGAKEVVVEGATVGEALADLERRFPAVGRRVLDEQGSIRRHVNVYLGEERVRDPDQPAEAGAELTILAAVSGGCGRPHRPVPGSVVAAHPS